MGLTVVSAVIASISRAAGDGATLAKAIVTAFVLVAIFFALLAIAFVLSWASAKLIYGKFDNAREGSPFAAEQLPPQQLKPRETER